MKTTIKRPTIHWFIIFGYIATPFASILLLMIFANVPLSLVIQRIFGVYGYLGTVWMLSAPVVGIGFLFIHKVSWFIFLGHSSLLLVDYVLKWAIRPGFYWRTTPSLLNLLVLTGNLALVVIIGYIVQRDFRAPYFQALNRGWRMSKRVPINHWILINGEKKRIDDISPGGCSATESGSGLMAGERVSISYKTEPLTFECQGEIRRHGPDGYGIQFLSLPKVKSRAVKRMIKNRNARRSKVELDGSWSFDNKPQTAKVLNMSEYGCFVQTDVNELSEGKPAVGHVELQDNFHFLPGRLVWVNRKTEGGRPVGFGFRFNRRQPALAHSHSL